MCGIVAFKGNESAVPLVLAGLKQLEYRGYDSWGIASLANGKIACKKSIGRIGDVSAKELSGFKESHIGIGHCLHPNTFVQLPNGEVKKIKDIGNESVLSLSFDSLKFTAKMARAYKHRCPPNLFLLRVAAASIKCTANHKLFVVSNGELVEKEAAQISVGDLIPIVKRINVKGKSQPLKAVFSKRYYSPSSKLSKIVKSKIKKIKSKRKLAADIGVTFSYLNHILQKDRNIREDILIKLASYFELQLNRFSPVHSLHGKFFRPPTKTSPELMQIIGYLIGDGYVGERNVRFKDEDVKLLEYYNLLFKRVFNIGGKVVKLPDSKAFMLEVNSAYLCKWLEENFREACFKHAEKAVPLIIARAAKKEVNSFLRGLFDAEGCVSLKSRQLRLALTNEGIIRIVQLFLLRSAIVSSSGERKTKWGPCFELFLNSQDSLLKFKKCISFTSKTKEQKLERILKNMVENLSFSIKQIPVDIRDFRKRFNGLKGLKSKLKGKGFISEKTALKILALLKNKANSSDVEEIKNFIKKYLDGDIVFQKVLEKKKISANCNWVYDLEVNRTPNFIVNGVLSHNSRWATHGAVTEQNAHPHFDCGKKIAIVHNGIIENFSSLKQQLLAKGHCFRSETDSEVIAHLIEEERKNCSNFSDAVAKALAQLHGSFAIAAIDSDSREIIGARKNSPLVVGFAEGAFFLASDVTAFLQHTKKAAFLLDNEMVLLNKNASFKNFVSNKPVQKKIETIAWKQDAASKGCFEHFMLKEIFEQPDRCRATMQGRLLQSGIKLPELQQVIENVAQFNRIVFVGCGTAYHAGMVAEYIFEELCKLPVATQYASEFRYRQPVIDEKTLVIAISQSGETADTLAAVREAKARKATVVSIINVVGSTIARESDFIFYINAGPEIGVASTKAFTCQLAALSMIAIAFAQQLKSAEKSRLAELADSLKKLPGQIEEVLQESKKIEQIAEKYFRKRNALFLGRGVNYPIALEGALKLKEISYVHAEAMPAAEMKHGPIALIDKEMPVVFIAVNDKSYEKILGNIEEVKARHGKVIAIANNGNSKLQEKVDAIIFVPKTLELLQPIVNIVPLQLFAYHVAKLRGCDIDKPKNLAKSVTVE